MGQPACLYIGGDIVRPDRRQRQAALLAPGEEGLARAAVSPAGVGVADVRGEEIDVAPGRGVTLKIKWRGSLNIKWRKRLRCPVWNLAVQTAFQALPADDRSIRAQNGVHPRQLILKILRQIMFKITWIGGRRFLLGQFY
jgi:hypothetical protein